MDAIINSKLSELKDKLSQGSLVTDSDDLAVGQIVYYNTDRSDGIIPHEGYDSRLKYVIISGSKSNKKEFLAVLINSNNNYQKPDKREEQYLIRQTDYPEILDHDSWVDCTSGLELKLSKLKSKKA